MQLGSRAGANVAIEQALANSDHAWACAQQERGRRVQLPAGPAGSRPHLEHGRELRPRHLQLVVADEQAAVAVDAVQDQALVRVWGLERLEETRRQGVGQGANLIGRSEPVAAAPCCSSQPTNALPCPLVAPAPPLPNRLEQCPHPAGARHTWTCMSGPAAWCQCAGPGRAPTGQWGRAGQQGRQVSWGLGGGAPVQQGMHAVGRLTMPMRVPGPAHLGLPPCC